MTLIDEIAAIVGHFPKVKMADWRPGDQRWFVADTRLGWAPNAQAAEIFAAHLATIHVPRRFYATALPGIPTIRVFEALACGIPLICAPWNDTEQLFRPGMDYLVARNGEEMERHLKDVARDAGLRASLAAHGLQTIRTRHSCAHRVDELLAIAGQLSCPNPVRKIA